MKALRKQAEALLARIGKASPEALAGAAAYLTGVVASKNVFTPLEGEDDMHKHMTAVVNALSDSNEDRFLQYLMKGFEAVRTLEPDELARWRVGAVVSHSHTSDTSGPGLKKGTKKTGVAHRGRPRYCRHN